MLCLGVLFVLGLCLLVLDKKGERECVSCVICIMFGEDKVDWV